MEIMDMEITRRHFFSRQATGVGVAALASLMRPGVLGATERPVLPQLPAKAKRVIYLFQSGGPSQIELFEHKPRMIELQGTDLPESVRMGQRLTAMSSGQARFPVVPSRFQLAQHGKSGAWVS